MRRLHLTSSVPALAASRENPRRRAAAAPPDLSLLWMFLAGALLMALASRAGGQTPPSATETPGFSGEVTVSEVLLDALITDREGNVIVGLGPEDFRVREEGRPVDLTGVAFYSNRRYLGEAGARSLGIDPDAVPDRRYFVLFFDDQRRNAASARGLLQRQMAAARDAEKWLREDLEPGDRVAVASFDFKLKLHADFTADREALIAAVRAAATGADGRADWPSRRAADGAGSLAANLPTGSALRDASPTIYEALQTLARAAEPIQGRKNLVLFSIGFGDVNSLGQYMRDARYHRPTMEALNAANVAVYSVDLTEPGTRHPFSDALSEIALITGGRFFQNVVNFATPLEQVSRTTNGYYLLSYRAEHPAGERGFQEVEVETVNPEFRVTARSGYRFGEQTAKD